MYKDTQRLKIKGWRKIYQENVKKKKQGLQSKSLIKQTLNQQRLKETKKGLLPSPPPYYLPKKKAVDIGNI